MIRRILIVWLLSIPAWGQSFYQFPVPLPGATFRVCPVQTQNPCPTPQPIYADQALTQIINQPAQTGVTGQFGFWVVAGQYVIQVAQPYNLVYAINLGGSGNAGTNPPIYPETYGASPTASASVNLTALQNAIFAALGCGSGLACRTNGSGLTNLNRPLVLSGLYHINGELKLYHAIGFAISCVNKLGSGIVQDTPNKRIFDGQSVAYGTISNCLFSTSAAQNVPLIDLDNDGSQGVDLGPQNVTFYDDVFSGGGNAFAGVQISKFGGTAQGDNIRCYNCYFSGFTQAAWMAGQASGVPATCSTLATNATRQQLIGGDMQSNPAYGVLMCGGDVDVIGTTMENGFTTQTGYDIYCPNTVGTSWCKAEGVRSESRRLIGGGKVILLNSWLIDQTQFPSPGGTCNPGSGGAPGTVVEGSIPGGQGIWYKCSVGGTFSGLGTTLAPRTSSGGTATTEVDAAGGLTVNAWTGWRVSWIGGTCANNYANITSNTATTYTFSGGIVSPFAGVSACAAPDATSTFVVEPQYGTFSTFVDGTATLSTMNESGMDNTGPGPTTAVIDNTFIPGEQLRLNIASNVNYLRVTRSDWNSGLVPLSGVNNVKIVTADTGGGFQGLFRKPISPTFSTLPTAWPDGGPQLYCVDCNSTCSAGSSTGQMCIRVNGVWTH